MIDHVRLLQEVQSLKDKHGDHNYNKKAKLAVITPQIKIVILE